MIGQSQPVVRNVRQEEVVLARLGIGHTRITHSYLFFLNQPACSLMIPIGDFFMKQINNCMMILFADTEF